MRPALYEAKDEAKARYYEAEAKIFGLQAVLASRTYHSCYRLL